MALRTVLLLIVAILSITCSAQDICHNYKSCLEDDDGYLIEYPKWNMVRTLPNELRVKVYIKEYAQNCPFAFTNNGQCRRFYKGYWTKFKTTDLVVRMRFHGDKDENWSWAGVAWRVRDDDAEGNSFKKLPGFAYQSETTDWYIYRYFFDENNWTEEQRERWLIPEEKEKFEVDFDVKTSCFKGKSESDCDTICDGYASTYLATEAYLRVRYSGPSTEPLKVQAGSLKVELLQMSTNYYLSLDFQRASDCENPHGLKATPYSYHFYLYENSKNGNPFKPIIWYGTKNVELNEDGSYAKFRDMYEIGNEWSQINLLLKAEGVTVPMGHAGACENFHSTFLGDIYLNWKEAYTKNLALAMTVCFMDKRLVCKKWFTTNEIMWNKKLKDQYKL